jgi:hypothetical protein
MARAPRRLGSKVTDAAPMSRAAGGLLLAALSIQSIVSGVQSALVWTA